MGQAIDTILRKTRELVQRGWPGEVLTVDNHVDGAFILGIAHIDAQGNVHPDQFWQEASIKLSPL